MRSHDEPVGRAPGRPVSGQVVARPDLNQPLTATDAAEPPVFPDGDFVIAGSLLTALGRRSMLRLTLASVTMSAVVTGEWGTVGARHRRRRINKVACCSALPGTSATRLRESRSLSRSWPAEWPDILVYRACRRGGFYDPTDMHCCLRRPGGTRRDGLGRAKRDGCRPETVRS